MNKKERDILFEDMDGYIGFVLITLVLALIEFEKKQIGDLMNCCAWIYEFTKKIYSGLDINTLFSTQVMVATLMLSVVAIIAGNVNDRCLNISYKRIFFKLFIYKNNYITLAFKMLITIFFGVFEYLFALKGTLFFTLICSLFFLFQMLKMTYVMISKKSLIYIRLYYFIKSEDDILKICVNKVRDWNISVNSHNQYIIQELALLKLIGDKSDEKDKKLCDERALKLIENEKEYLKNNIDIKIEKTRLFDADNDKNNFRVWIDDLLKP